jgi:hypothetical protein
MRVLITAAFAAAMAANTAFAATCVDQATTRRLAGDDRTRFVSKCEASGSGRMDRDECASEAKQKGLTGADKKGYIKQCVTDGIKK